MAGSDESGQAGEFGRDHVLRTAIDHFGLHPGIPDATREYGLALVDEVNRLRRELAAAVSKAGSGPSHIGFLGWGGSG